MENNLEKAVPRYTSYPTAPHFNSAVTAEVYGAWVDALSPEATLSLYLHVPFCRALCHYCGCHTKATLKQEPIEAYAARLAEEIVILANHAGKRRVTHLHWGGGTPSILGGDWLKRLTDEMHRQLNLTELREHAIELDPRYLTRPLAQSLHDIGVNRASLGIQDFSPHVQRAAGRIQPFDLAENAVALLRAAGIGSINLDLMYGLPKQTVFDVQRTAALASSLKPQRVAVFGYAHVPWFKPQQRLIDRRDLPAAEERLAQAKAAHDTFIQLGYRPVGLDHFALPDDELVPAAFAGRLHRNFQGYTVDDADALLGLGASAISRLLQGFAQNAPDIGNYSRAVAAGCLATVRGIALTDDDRVRGRIIEQLMCDMAVDLSAAGRADDDFSDALERLQPFADDGTLVIDGRHITVTEKGRPFVRLVASAFDAYLHRGPARHTAAV
jgi:oxygen-independent coproporphyrinogen-3 oxidase